MPTGSTWNHGGYNVNLAVGGKFDGGKGHASAYVDYRDTAAIWKDQRDYTNCSVSALGGTSGPSCGGSSTWQYGRFFTDTGDFVLDPGTGNLDTFRDRKSADVFNYAPFNFMQRNDTRWSGGGFSRYTVNEKFEPYAEVMVMNDYSDAQIAPSGDFFSTTEINCDNPMLSAQQRDLICTQNGYGPNDIAYLNIGRRNVEGGNRIDQLTHTNWRLLGGARGDLSPAWNYDVFGMNAQVNAPDVYINDFLSTRIQDSLIVDGTPGDPSTWHCRSGNAGCAPWNVFAIGGVTKAATDYLNVPYLYNSGTNTKMLGATLRGDLGRSGVKFPSATEGIQLALGGEIRKESLFVSPDYIRAQGLGAGSGGPTNAVDGSYKTNEIYGEARVPFVQDKSGIQDLSLELGYRLANYKALGESAKNNSSYKAILSYAPVAGLRFRGGFSRAVRAPNVQELFAPQSVGLSGSRGHLCGHQPHGHPGAVREDRRGRGAVRPHPGEPGLAVQQPPRRQPAPGRRDGGHDHRRPGAHPEGDHRPHVHARLLRHQDRQRDRQPLRGRHHPVVCEHRQSRRLRPDPPRRARDAVAHERRLHRQHEPEHRHAQVAGHRRHLQLPLEPGSPRVHRLLAPRHDDAGEPADDPPGRLRLRRLLRQPVRRSPAPSGVIASGPPGTPSSTRRSPLGWRYINKVLIDDASPNTDLGDPGLIARWKANGSYENPSYNWLDLAASYRFRDKISLTVGCNNLLDKEPPLGSGVSPNDYGPGMYGTYDYLGRALYANLQFGF